MLTGRQAWMLVHIGLSAMFIHGFTVTAKVLLDGREVIQRRTARSAALMAVASWLTVITGTWTVYAWYRAKPAHESFTVIVMAIRHRAVLLQDGRVRQLVTGMLSLAVFATLVAATLGAAINKIAPNQFLGR